MVRRGTTVTLLLAGLVACEPLDPPPGAVLDLDGPTAVADCRPCIVRLSTDGGQPWTFTFERKALPDGEQVIEAIRARPPRSSEEQLMPVEGMLPVEVTDGFRFGGEDLDGDGWRDLVLVTVDGGANVYAAYWHYDPTTARFDPLGTLPLLGRDPESGRLVGLEHGSTDGIFFTRTDYGFEDGRMVVLAVEARLPVDDPNKARHLVQERRGDALVTAVDEVASLPKPAG